MMVILFGYCRDFGCLLLLYVGEPEASRDLALWPTSDLNPEGIFKNNIKSLCYFEIINNLFYQKWLYLWFYCNFKPFCSLINSVLLTPNTPLIQLWCARSKLNMDEISGLNIHLWYVDIPKKVLLKSLHAQRRSFLLLNLWFDVKIPLPMK